MRHIEGPLKLDGRAKPGNDQVNNSTSTSCTKYLARVSLLPEQFEVLERVYSNNLYPDTSLKRKLADDLKVDFGKIRTWFTKRRQKERQGKRKLSA